MATSTYPPTLIDWNQIRPLKQGLGYVVQAGTSPFLIPATSHLQGANITVDAWSGALVSGHLTGNKVYCQCSLDPLGTGNVTVVWGGMDVGSVIISSVGMPYVTASGASPLTIPASVHGQGYNIAVDCWSGGLVAGNLTGTKFYPQIAIDGSGNVTVTWSGADVGCVMVSGATNPTPYVANATVSPQLVVAQLHQQGPNVSVEAWSGPLISGHLSGTRVMASPSLDNSGNGNVTVSWGGFDVGCFIISASGPSTSAGPAGPAGPQGPVGPPGPGAGSYITASTTSPQTILQTTHMEGKNASAICYDGPVVSGACTGNVVSAGISKNSAGDITVAWGGTTVQSIQIRG